MQVEDNLTLESAKYNEIIKTRVKQMQDKLDDQNIRIKTIQREKDLLSVDLRQAKQEHSNLSNNHKSAQLDLKIANKEIKLKEDKV
jgi:cell fate regulator YaaT (PSP1 superfamily)